MENTNERFGCPMEDRDCRGTATDLVTWIRRAGKSTTEAEAVECCDKIRQLSFDSRMESGLCGKAVASCLSVVQSFESERSVQCSGLLALAALCEKQHLSALIGERGGVHQLLDAWTRFAADDVIIKNCVVTMRSLSETEQNREIFCTNGGIEKVVTTFQTFPARVSIRSAAAVLIANLCFENKQRRKSVIDSKATEWLINGLKNFNTPNHFRVHTNTCLALRNIAMDVAGCDEILRVDPELRAIAKVLQTSGSHSSTASEALGVVYNVVVGKGTASLSTTCAEQILSSILSFLDRTHRYLSKYDACHEICLATTCSVVHTTDKVKEQLSLKLRQQLVAASLKYSQKYMSFKSPLSPSIVTNACTGIRVLVVDSETRAEFANTDGNGPCTLVKCVTFLSERPLQVEHALLALGNAVFDSSRGKEQVRLSGGIQVVLDVINRNYFVASVAEASLLAIQGICTQDDSSGNLATTLKVHGACVRTMNSFRDNPAIQERALAAMLSFGTDGEAVRELKALSVLDIAATAAAAFPFSKLIAAQEHQLRWLVKGDDVGPTRPSHDRLERLKSLPLRTWKSFTRG